MLAKVPPYGPSVPRRGNGLTRLLGRTVFSLLGWRFVGGLPDRPKFLIVGAPHTSNWDFVVGMAALLALGFEASWMGKHTLFWWPFSVFLRWLGGVPVDRTKPHGAVDQTVDAFRARDRFVLGLTPQGTRRRGAPWKMGFYHIARGAEVPVVPVSFDYPSRTLHIGSPLTLGADPDAELARVKAFFRGVRGKRWSEEGPESGDQRTGGPEDPSGAALLGRTGTTKL